MLPEDGRRKLLGVHVHELDIVPPMARYASPGTLELSRMEVPTTSLSRDSSFS